MGVSAHIGNDIASARARYKLHFTNVSAVANGGAVSVLPRSKFFSTAALKSALRGARADKNERIARALIR
jgi:hypothetical protein